MRAAANPWVGSSWHNRGMDLRGDKLGASRSVVEGPAWDWPLHGLRHPPEADTSGWYLWTGELLQDDDFFLPWHVAHVLDRCPELAPLLELPPGSRFMYAPDYFDVWQDDSLLDV